MKEKKAAIITGASHGLGAAISAKFISQGIRVFGISRTPPENPAVEHIQADVTIFSQLDEAAARLKKESIGYLVNSAGVLASGLAMMASPDVTQKVIQVNLLGTIFSCQVFSRLLVRSGGGAIVNLSSIATQLGLRGESIYIASKAGVEGFTYAFAREMADFNVTVNSVSPGPVATGLIGALSADAVQKVVEQQIFSKGSSSEDVAETVWLLCSPGARKISGEVIAVGGV